MNCILFQSYQITLPAPAIVEVANRLANVREPRVRDLVSALVLPLLRVVWVVVVLEAQAASLIHACRRIVALRLVSRVSCAKGNCKVKMGEVLTPVALVGEERYLLLKMQLVQK